MTLAESWELAKSCFHIMRRDKEMLLYPAVMAAVIIAVILAFIFSALYNPLVFIVLLISIPLMAITLSFLGVFFEAAVVGCAGIRLDGGNPTFMDGLRIASRRSWLLFKWTLMSILVGLILGLIGGILRAKTTVRVPAPRLPGHPPRFPYPGLPGFALMGLAWWSRIRTQFSSEERSAPGSFMVPEWGVGDIIAGVLGMAWSVATFFVIPLIVYEGLGPLKAIKRSWGIIKMVWKETLILKLGFGLLFGLLFMLGLAPLFAALHLGVATRDYIPVVFGVMIAATYWVVLSCVSFVMKGILRAVLYKYSARILSKDGLKCPSCGLRVPEADAVYCPNCGKKILEEVVKRPLGGVEFMPLNRLVYSLCSRI